MVSDIHAHCTATLAGIVSDDQYDALPKFLRTLLVDLDTSQQTRSGTR